MKRVHFLTQTFLTITLLGGSVILAACSSEDTGGDGDGDGDGDMMGDGDAATGGGVGDGDGDLATGGGVGDGDGDLATGGGTGDGDGDIAANEIPAEMTEAGFAAFLAAETYKQAPWVGDSAIRGSDNAVNPHGDELQVWFNTPAVESVEAFNADSTSDTSPLNTMVVKEIFEAGVLVGHAVYVKTGMGDTMNDWHYYCDVPETSSACTGSAETTPLFGTGLTECGFCHGQVPYAPLP